MERVGHEADSVLTMQELSTDLRNEVDALSQAFGLGIQEERYEPDHFGDAILVLSGRSVSFRLVRERTELFLDVLGAANDWVDVRGILFSLGLLPSPRENYPLPELIDLIVQNAEVFSHRTRG